ncbi:hypothetical protein BLAT2472_50199 [Burkholderia latens]
MRTEAPRKPSPFNRTARCDLPPEKAHPSETGLGERAIYLPKTLTFLSSMDLHCTFTVQNGRPFPEILTANPGPVPRNLTFGLKCPKDRQNRGTKKVPQILTYVCTGRKLCA